MNSHWKGNLIIFVMALVPTCSNSHIKIRVSNALESQPRVKLDENHQVARVWCINMKNFVWDNFNRLLLSVNLGLIWPEKALQLLWCPNGLHHVDLDISTALWRKYSIFGIFGVWHANRGKTKYVVYNYPFFIWHIECNERCWVKNVILHFIAPKLLAEIVLFMGQYWPYLARLSYCS